MPLVDWELTLGGRDLPLKVAKMIDRKKCKKKKNNKKCERQKKDSRSRWRDFPTLFIQNKYFLLYLFHLNDFVWNCKIKKAEIEENSNFYINLIKSNFQKLNSGFLFSSFFINKLINVRLTVDRFGGYYRRSGKSWKSVSRSWMFQEMQEKWKFIGWISSLMRRCK